MRLIYVIDDDLCMKMICAGCQLISKKADINGKTLWMLDLGDTAIDIKSKTYERLCFAAERPVMTF